MSAMALKTACTNIPGITLPVRLRMYASPAPKKVKTGIPAGMPCTSANRTPTAMIAAHSP